MGLRRSAPVRLLLCRLPTSWSARSVAIPCRRPSRRLISRRGCGISISTPPSFPTVRFAVRSWVRSDVALRPR